MRLPTRLAFTLIVAFVPFSTFGTAAHAACNASQRGTAADCPEYTAPATTAVPDPSMDGSVVVPGNSFTLFNGVTLPNGFMVEINSPNFIPQWCLISDNGPASLSNPRRGFLIGGIYVTAPLSLRPVTPPGYKPIGPVSINCIGGGGIEARGW